MTAMFDWMREWIGQAIIAAIVSSLVTGWVVSRRQAALMEQTRHRQRLLKLVKALAAEINAGIGSIDGQLSKEEADRALKDGNAFATPDETDFVFESIRGDLTLLPPEIIEEVTLYYRLAKRSNLMTRDLRDKAFIDLPAEEKHRFVRRLLAVQADQKAAGTAALAAIADYASDNGITLGHARRAAPPEQAA